MSIRFTVSGITFEADTPEEACDAAMRITKMTQPRPAPTIATAAAEENGPAKLPRPSRNLFVGSDHTETIGRFLERLNDNGMKVIFTLAEADRALSTTSLAEAAGMMAMSLPPIIKHILSAAQRSGMDWTNPIRRKHVMLDGKQQSLYVLDKEVMEAMKSLK